MTFGYSMEKTRELLLADEWFGYAESEWFLTMFFLLQMLCISNILQRQSQSMLPNRRLINTDIALVWFAWPRLEKPRQWWRWSRIIPQQSAWCKHIYRANAHGSRFLSLVPAPHSRQLTSSFEQSYDWHGTEVHEGRCNPNGNVHRAVLWFTSTIIAREFPSRPKQVDHGCYSFFLSMRADFYDLPAATRDIVCANTLQKIKSLDEEVTIDDSEQ